MTEICVNVEMSPKENRYLICFDSVLSNHNDRLTRVSESPFGPSTLYILYLVVTDLFGTLGKSGDDDQDDYESITWTVWHFGLLELIPRLSKKTVHAFQSEKYGFLALPDDDFTHQYTP